MAVGVAARVVVELARRGAWRLSRLVTVNQMMLVAAPVGTVEVVVRQDVRVDIMVL